MIGRKLSHYEILDEISRGGMGVVYRALDVKLGREVALKVLPEALLHDPGRRERLLQEARAASTLEHPHIAVIHEVDDVDGVTFIAMELIRGEKLSDTLSRGPLPVKRALDLGVEIAEGLARAHERAVIHRDVKPANVMVTEEGHAKIIDFGLAKLTEPVSHEAATATVGRTPTEPGVVMGTAAYMSPEQARGVRVDHRSDIFSLGVTLFEMVTGHAAFRGASNLDTMHAILTQPMPPLAAVIGLTDEAAAQVQRVIEKCSAKDPDERYQGMKDVVVDLRAARRVLESSQGSALIGATSARTTPVAAAPRWRRALVGIGIAAVLATAFGVWWSGRDVPVAPAPSGKPGVAVLYFENNTGDPSLDWMRTGLTDMLVTDLSQSTDFEVLGTDRLVQILQELKRTDDRVIPADVILQIADRAAVNIVLVGSFVKAGDAIRINARLQEARTGRIVTSERVDGTGEASVFALVDELTRRFRSKMTAAIRPIVEKPGAVTPAAELDRDVTAVTSSNIEAYRHYVEGLAFHERGLSAQAIAPMEQAVKLDPDFAMALAKLAVLHSNLGHTELRDEYAKRAVAHVSRLTARERYYIEGFYYTLRPETLARGIEAYRQGLALHPEHHASRHNLGLQYFQLDRFNEALEQYEELARRGTTNPSTVGNLANCYLTVGNVARALDVTDGMVKRNPESATALRFHGEVLIGAGRFDDARAAFDKSMSLNPRGFTARLGAISVAVLQDRRADAEVLIRDLGASSDGFQQALSMFLTADLHLAKGRGAEAMAQYERAQRVPGAGPANRAFILRRMSQVFVRSGRTAEALVQAQLAVNAGQGSGAEFESLEQLALAQSAAGRPADATATLARLESRAAILPGPRELRRVHVVKGTLALARGDNETAVAELTKAEGMLAVNSLTVGPPTPHAETWYATALALLQAGRDADAAIRFERLQSRYERISDLDAYARSFYLLGQIYERRGDAVKAREQFARFVALRGDGDLDRGWVPDARKKIAR